ncbi:sugar kinase [Kosmotoga pacifica]|uniref:Carbohydrate kinase PfkB domain-containing protein n=1 Tax=Kosmotoga pacifica TaxID=1330330 RepID=A0A0G2Z869_9BACT|nr:sugar kinase [Kosmotoga pacifica]AKI97762.1 hypothetical protein IX53_07980 [Kosmotoga pacifica]
MKKVIEVYCWGEPLAGFYSKNPNALGKPGEFRMTWGGDTSNVALSVRKLGHSSGYMTKIGNDFVGQGLLKLWKSEGVDVTNVFLDREHSTGMYFVDFDENGEHIFYYRRKGSAASTMNKDFCESIQIDEGKIFHLSGISQAISFECLECSFDLIERFKSNGFKISYDLNYREKLWLKKFARNIYRVIIEDYADIVSFNEKEALILDLPDNPFEAVSQVLEFGPEIVAYKLGSKGAVLGMKEEIVAYSAPKVEVKDTVGAGDAFTGAVLVGILEEMSAKDLLKFAISTAALTCKNTGSVEGQPRRNEIKDFIKKIEFQDLLRGGVSK